MVNERNFLEIRDTEEANKVDLNLYRLERFSESRSAWLFVRRATRRD